MAKKKIGFLSIVLFVLQVSATYAAYTGPELKIPLPAPNSWCVNTAVNDPGDWYHTNEDDRDKWYAGGYYSIDFDDNYGLSGDATETSECYDTDLDNNNGDSEDGDIYVNVVAAAGGTVTFATDEATAGTCSEDGVNCYVAIDHGNGYTTWYMHLQSGSITVQKDDVVQKGQVLGLMGSTGPSTGPHAHFQVLYYGQSKSTIAQLEGITLDETSMLDYEVGQAYTSSNGESNSCILPDLLSRFVASDSTSTNNPDLSATYLNESDPSTSILEVAVSIEYDYSNGGTKGTFTVNKEAGGVFTTSGKMYLQVGSYESYGTTHDEADIASYVSTGATLTENFNNYCADSYPKDYYIRYESDEGGYAVVGPITISVEAGLCTDYGVCLESTLTDTGDADGDGLVNGAELEDYQTNPTDSDTDDDGLNDGDEVNTYHTDPLGSDTDGDLMMDGPEVSVSGTSPTDSDSDDDGTLDGYEEADDDGDTDGDGGSYDYGDGSDEDNASDWDGDGLNNETEAAYGTDPHDADTDSDGLTDGEEVLIHQTDANDADSDDDGLDDGNEVAYGSDFRHPDSDNDGIEDGDEVHAYDTNPMDVDSDDDGIEDGDEVEAGTDPDDTDSDNDGINDGDDAYPLLPAGEIEAILEATGSATNYGQKIAIDGDVVVVRGIRDDPTDTWGSFPDLGSVFVYRWDDSQWNLEAELTGEDTYDFGHSLALDGDVLVIGGDSRSDYHYGAAYVYRFDGTAWNEEATLTPSTAQSNNGFGYSVAVDNDVVAVSADGYMNDYYYNNRGYIAVGAVYTFRYDGISWNEETQIVGTDTNYDQTLETDLTNPAIALSSGVLVIGDRNYNQDGDDDEEGGAYVYRSSGSSWVLDTTLTASDGGPMDSFGTAVAAEDDVVVVGAPGDGYDTGVSSGSAYVYTWDGSTWNETEKLTASNQADYDYFGSSVNISDELLVIGAPADVSGALDIGKAYSFRWDGDNWTEEEQFTASDAGDADYYGTPVAVSGEIVLASTGGAGEAVYVYSRPDPDDDNDGLTNDQETEYGTDASVSDTDGDTIGDYEEVQAGTDPADADSDDDGLNDAEDSEPLVALDTDGDGVTDISDACTATAVANSYDTVDTTGCALSDLDTDDDGLSDYVETVTCSAVDESKIYADDASANDSFGHAVALHDDAAIISAPYYSEDGWSVGSAYIFRKTGTTWAQETKLLASDRNYNRDHALYNPLYYGTTAAISDNVAVVGAYGDGENGEYAGAAYAYNYDGSSWNETKLLADDGVTYDYYGYSVAASGDIIVVGALYTTNGSAYVYRFNGSTWNEEAVLTASDGTSGGSDYYGSAVAVSDDVIMVGAYSNAGTGAVYVYRFDGTTWNEESKLTPSTGATGDEFGRAVALTDDTAVIGAQLHSASGEYAGATYTYRFDGTTWNETQLAGSGVSADDRFGWAVAGNTQYAVVGAKRDDGAGDNAGTAYLQCWDGSAWRESVFTASTVAAGDEFGSALALQGTTLLAGVANDATVGIGAGSVYMYELTEPSFTNVADSDSDDDGILDGADAEPLIPLATDGDSDGVDDLNDTCSDTTPVDTADTINETGCALSQLNSDSDAFSDYEEVIAGYDPNAIDYVVTKTTDTKDGSCDSDCSLREAIIAAAAETRTVAVQIDFAIPDTDSGCNAGVCTIGVTRGLGTISRGNVYINGYTQAGSSQPTDLTSNGWDGSVTIELSGAAAGSTASGISLASSNNRVSGLAINGFSKQGVYISSGSDNTVTGCVIGTDVAGGSDVGNSGYGVYATANATSGTTIEHSLIAGNNAAGLLVDSDSTVTNNLVGTNASGAVAIKNGTFGLYVYGNNNVITDNVISGNGSSGVYIAPTASTTWVTDNDIGTVLDGQTSLGNGVNGIFNQGTGTIIGTNSDGIADADEGNVISGNNKMGIYQSAGTGGSIAGNRIGTDWSGSLNLSNRQNGIYISKGSHRIGSDWNGSADVEESNIIAYNGLRAVYVYSSNAVGNSIRGNSFFTNVGPGITLASSGNNSKPAPHITSAISTDTLTVSGTAQSGDMVDLYIASSDNEGQDYLGSTTADSAGAWTMTSAAVASDARLVTTATDAINGTSTFSSSTGVGE